MDKKRLALAVTATSVAAATALGMTATTASANTPATKTTLSSWPGIGTGGLIIRDVNGNDLGSGIGEAQYFKFIACGPKNSGLIQVVQELRGNKGGGGWGSLYSGYVKQKYTQAPSMFPCN